MTDHTGPILVIGATGQQGGAAARALLDRGREVHALVRDPETPAARGLRQAGARLVTADLDDPESLRAAMTDVHGVFLVLNMLTGAKVTHAGVEAEVRRGTAVADIAAKTGVAHLESKRHIEDHIEALGVPATVLRPVFFMENFASHTRPAIVDGELVVSLALRPGTAMQFISTRDIGAFAALAFIQPERFLGRPVVIAGDRLTGPELAERFGAVSGIPARFQQVPIEQLRAFDEEVARMFEWFDSGDIERGDIPALRELHPGLMNLNTWLRRAGWHVV